MTDPGGGYGWRTGERATPFGFRRPPEPPDPRRLCVLLLPRALVQFILRDQAEDLLRAPGVVAIEPARVSYGAYLRMPTAVADGLALTQARRLKLPGTPAAIVIFH